MYVNLTYWGADSNNSRWLVDRTDLWCVDPKVSEEEAFVEMFADLVQYLREEKGYTCVKEVTLVQRTQRDLRLLRDIGA